ncbi:MAG: aminodeoxychorismate synthase component I [Planctomycetota bacterium]
MAIEWQLQEVTWPTDPPAAAAAFADGAELAWLDSSIDVTPAVSGARYSLICARLIACLAQCDRQPATLTVAGRICESDVNAWQLWRRTLERLPRAELAPCGLTPGWIGYVGFEAAQLLERLPASHRADLGLPLLRLALYDRGIVLDHHQRRALAISAPGVAEALGLHNADRYADWIQRWQAAAETQQYQVQTATPRLCHEIAQAEHERIVGRALEYIAAGDIYQVNLAQCMRLEGVGDPVAVYAAIRRANPAQYGALLRWDDCAVASVSPELFLRCEAGRVLTRPIKGTRPRTRDAALDEVYCQALRDSAKDAAELAMIVDLHRNDLGRVCEYGSVRVSQPRVLETHPTVFHTVAEVTGQLARGRDGLDLLAACFPAGSVTGVPKIRAIEIIDELEPVARGVYTGAVGVLGLDGQMTFNVAIRTLQIRGSMATLYVGGGIVADSDPADEYQETLDKARGILSGLLNGPAGMVATRSQDGLALG